MVLILAFVIFGGSVAEHPVELPEPTPVYGEVLTAAQVLGLTRQVGLPDIFVEIARCESGFKPGLKQDWLNPDGSADHGLWQINDRYWSGLPGWNGRYTPLGNARLAKAVFDQQGIGAWKWSKKCWG